MSLEESLIEKFKENGVFLDDELYIKIPYTVEFIKACTESQLAIAGVEFFQMKDTEIHPQFPIKSLDCSSLLNKKKHWKDIVAECNDFTREVMNIEWRKNSSQYCHFTVIAEGE